MANWQQRQAQGWNLLNPQPPSHSYSYNILPFPPFNSERSLPLLYNPHLEKVKKAGGGNEGHCPGDYLTSHSF